MRKMVLPALVISVLLPTVPAFGGWGFCGKPSRETTQVTQKKKKKPSRVRRWLGCATPQDAPAPATAGSSLTQNKPKPTPVPRVRQPKPEDARASVALTIPGPPPRETSIHDHEGSTIGLRGTPQPGTHIEEPRLLQSISAREDALEPDIIAQAADHEDEAFEEQREELEQEIAEKAALQELIPATDPKHEQIEKELQELREQEHQLESHGVMRPSSIPSWYTSDV